MQEIKLWKINGNSVSRVKTAELNLEKRLEEWVLEDIAILSKDLVIVGSQVLTSFNKVIDILAINSLGELVIIELKKDKTYREVIAQVLDYATWVKDLSYDEINTIFNKYNKNQDYKDVTELYYSSFDKQADEVEFNSDHKILIIGSEIDDATVRIIDYLSSEPYSLNINAVNFNYFKDEEGQEYIAQSFIKSESHLTEEGKSKKRKRRKSKFQVLFETGKLNIDDEVYCNIIENKQEEAAWATIKNKKTKCLMRKNGDKTLYSFSGMRKQLVSEFKLQDVNENWGFGLRDDWEIEGGRTLNELLEE